MSIKRKISSAFRLFNFERSISLWRGLQSGSDYKVLEKPSFKKALILAPHPDDEALGCGGMAQMFSNTAEIDVVYIFCGDKSSQSTYSLERRREAQEAQTLMGIREQYFLSCADGTSAPAGELRKIIANNKYEAIFCPNPVDPHADHAETAIMLAKILKLSNITTDVWLYEIWNPLTFFNRLVVVDHSRKIELIKAYRSQLENRDYTAAILGLNIYRGEIMGEGNAAEAFMAVPAEVFVKIMLKSQQ